MDFHCVPLPGTPDREDPHHKGRNKPTVTLNGVESVCGLFTTLTLARRQVVGGKRFTNLEAAQAYCYNHVGCGGVIRQKDGSYEASRRTPR